MPEVEVFTGNQRTEWQNGGVFRVNCFLAKLVSLCVLHHSLVGEMNGGIFEVNPGLSYTRVTATSAIVPLLLSEMLVALLPVLPTTQHILKFRVSYAGNKDSTSKCSAVDLPNWHRGCMVALYLPRFFKSATLTLCV